MALYVLKESIGIFVLTVVLSDSSVSWEQEDLMLFRLFAPQTTSESGHVCKRSHHAKSQQSHADMLSMVMLVYFSLLPCPCSSGILTKA